MARVKFEHIFKAYGKVRVVEDFDLDINDGEFVALVGPSGCGKSTTLRMVAGLEDITSGKLWIGERIANHLPPKLRGIAMVFQSYALFPHMTVEANIGFGLKLAKIPLEERRRKIDWALDLLDLKGLGHRYPRELSGGQRQRVALGRALVLDPQVLLLDEPLSNLDAKLRLKMRTELKRIHKHLRSTTIYVTHDQIEAMTLSDRIAIMNQGRLQQAGTPLEVFNQPNNLFVAGFIGSPPINVLRGRVEERDGTPRVATSSFSVPLEGKRAAAVRQWQGGPDVLLGIRPQDLFVARNGNAVFDARVDVVEPLGDSQVATVVAGEDQLQAVLPVDVPLSPDTSLRMGLNQDHIHLFDVTTEQALF